MGVVSRIRQLLASNTELEHGDVAREGAARRCAPLTACQERKVVRIFGVVSSITCPPAGTSPVFVVTLDTGDGEVELRWLGQKKVCGVTNGVNLVVQGRLVRDDGMLTIFNPAYEVVSHEGAGSKS